MDRTHERTQQNAREPLPYGNGDEPALVDEHWDQLLPADSVGEAFRAISREQLADAMRAAALLALQGLSAPTQTEVPMTDTPPMDPRVQQLVDETLCTGTAGALAQSLKVMGQQLAYDGHEGWGVVARRAEQFVRAMHMQVTRFLQQPDCHLRHATLDFDLLAAHVDVADVGRVMVHCTDTEGSGWHPFPLEDLHPAGPVDDAVRSMVSTMVQAFVLEHIDQAKARGELPGFETTLAPRMVAEVQGLDVDHPANPTPGEPGVHPMPAGGIHHLQVHDEYVMGEDGPHADAVFYEAPSMEELERRRLARGAVGFDAPEGDQAFGENGS